MHHHLSTLHTARRDNTYHNHAYHSHVLCMYIHVWEHVETHHCCRTKHTTKRDDTKGSGWNINEVASGEKKIATRVRKKKHKKKQRTEGSNDARQCKGKCTWYILIHEGDVNIERAEEAREGLQGRDRQRESERQTERQWGGAKDGD